VTPRGRLLVEVLAGLEVSDVSQRRMHQLCGDLHAMTPPRYLRAHPQRGGGYRVALIGPAVHAHRRDLP